MNHKRLLLIVLSAILTFGGTFTCHAHSGDPFPDDPKTPAK